HLDRLLPPLRQRRRAQLRCWPADLRLSAGAQHAERLWSVDSHRGRLAPLLAGDPADVRHRPGLRPLPCLRTDHLPSDLADHFADTGRDPDATPPCFIVSCAVMLADVT